MISALLILLMLVCASYIGFIVGKLNVEGDYSADFMDYCEHCYNASNERYNALNERCNALENALDKASKQLEMSILTITTKGRVWGSEEWKEWLLKDD